MTIENSTYDHTKSSRVIVPSMSVLETILTTEVAIEYPSVRMERIYFDSQSDWLNLGAHLRAIRCIDEGASTDFILSYRSKEGAAPEKVPYPLRYESLVDTAEKWFGIKNVTPRFRVSYLFSRYQLAENMTLNVLQNLTYFALIDNQELPMGKEQSIRIELVYPTSIESARSQKILKAFHSLPKLPQNNIRLMGFCMLKKLIDPPVYEELMGFEYDMKFKLSGPEFDFECLPFPFLDMRISGSLRRYYDGYRAGLRDGTAIIVRKGKKEDVRGVIRRTEVKERGIEAWRLDETDLEMRRYKREVRFINPDSHRLYSISLHQCISTEEMYQLEVGYDGTLVPSTLPLIKDFWQTGKVKPLIELADLLEQAKYPALASDCYKRASELSDLVDAPDNRGRIDRKIEEGTWTQDAENEIIEDLLRIRSILLETNKVSPTKKTKRKWLKQVIARRS
jgi:hypothetical protein